MPHDPLGNAAKRVADASPGPWKRWRRISRHGRAIKFIQAYCAAPKGKGHGLPLKLAPFQKTFLEEALAENVDASVLETPRGNGKSSFGGALAVWATFDDDETGAPQVPIIATTVGQAIKSCYGVAVSMIKRQPELLSRALVYTGVTAPRVSVPFNEGELFPISNDVDGLQGLDYSLSIVDEIGFQPIESWTSLFMGGGKRSRSLALGVGTPGFDRENALWHLQSILDEGGVIPRFAFRRYHGPEEAPSSDRRAWRIANPAIKAGFLRESALETDLASSPDAYFRIFRLGLWVDGVESWLGPDGRAIWARLTAPYDFELQAPTWVGIDVGLKRDSTSVVAVQRDEVGRLRALNRVWLPMTDQPVDVTDVMAYIRELALAYDLQEISFDPRFFDVPAKMLADEGLPMLEVPQSVERMTTICGDLLTLIKAGQILHDGDPTLATHILNAIPRFNERGFTLQKSKARGRIDSCIALALAVDRATRQEVKPKLVPLVAWA